MRRMLESLVQKYEEIRLSYENVLKKRNNTNSKNFKDLATIIKYKLWKLIIRPLIKFFFLTSSLLFTLLINVLNGILSSENKHRKNHKIFSIVLDLVVMYILLIIFTDSLKSFLYNMIFLVVFILLQTHLTKIPRLCYQLLLYPLISSWLVLFIYISINELFNIKINSLINGFVIFGIIIVGIPILSFILYIRNYKKVKRTSHLRVALEFNYVLLLISTSLIFLYLSLNSNLETLMPRNILNNLAGNNTSVKDFLTTMTNLMTIPFLFSNALLKWYTEYLDYKNKLENDTI